MTIPPARASGPGSPPPGAYRVATFNTSLFRPKFGDLVSELSSPGSTQAGCIAEIIQRVRPDLLLINEFDYDPGHEALDAFKRNYLEVPHGDAAPIRYDFDFVAPSNTGLPIGLELDEPGSSGWPKGVFGYGAFPGQYGMAVLARYPIDHDNVRTFQRFLWQDMPGALLPVREDGVPYLLSKVQDALRLSSKSHWDVPIHMGKAVVHFLVSHPTPPILDQGNAFPAGININARRNHDEIRFWADYISPTRPGYMVDDDRSTGGLPAGALFVIAGDLNADPYAGDSLPGAARQLLDHPLVNNGVTPGSEGAMEEARRRRGINQAEGGHEAHYTADFSESGAGLLRVDYVLPYKDIAIQEAGVFWPSPADPLFRLVGRTPFPGSDHRLVWIDVRLPSQVQLHIS